MSSDLRIENILIQVRCLLQDNNVKLWLAPYYAEGVGTCDAEIEKLGQLYCQLLNIPLEYCVTALNELQNNALDKIRARDDFTRTGIATLKVRVPGQIGGTKLLTVHAKLTDNGDVLQEQVAKELSTTKSCIKLIASGKIVDSLKSLHEQGIKNNQQLMAIILLSTPNEANKAEDLYDRVRKAKEDAALLSTSNNQQFMHMEDQHGNAVHLPPEEQQSLMMALALHEKGKAALKTNNFSEALVWFLEADEAYKNCQSKLLESVDNYGLLNLDISWCYLCLKSVTQLPDAEARLNICERSFKRCYGENLDRVTAVKGSSENERALIMRLHLLQGVLYFHLNRRSEAQRKLLQVDSEFKALKVDENHVLALAEMGYTINEARMALRSCGNNIDQAISHILVTREERKNARKRGKKEREIASTSKSSETWVNPRSLSTLTEMGFPLDVASVALKKTNNCIASSITLLQQNYNQLLAEVPQQSSNNDALIDDLVKMGFDAKVVRLCLKTITDGGNPTIDMLVEKLFNMQNDGGYAEALRVSSGSESEAEASSSKCSTCSSSCSCTTDSESEKVQPPEKKEHQLQEAFDRLADGVSKEDDNYLDLPLVQEEMILNEYKQYLTM